MKRKYRLTNLIFSLLIIFLVATVFQGCTNDDSGSGNFIPTPSPTSTVSPTPSPTSTPEATPVINSVNPDTFYGGDTITITGTGFGAERASGAGAVLFNGIAASDYVSWSDSQIVCKAPAMGNTGNAVVDTGTSRSNVIPFTRVRKWREANVLENDTLGTDSSNVRIAYYQNGDAICVYMKDSILGGNDIFYSLFDVTEGSWSDPVKLCHYPEILSADFSMHTDGNGVLALFVNDTDVQILAYELNADRTWQPVQRLDTSNGATTDISDIKTIISASGDKAVTFVKNSGAITRSETYCTVRRTGQAWPAPVTIDDTTGNDSLDSTICFDSNNNLFVLMRQTDSVSRKSISSRRLTPGGVWSPDLASPPALLDDSGAGNSLNVSIAADNNGNVVVIFRQLDTYTWVYANWCDSSGNWRGITSLADPAYLDVNSICLAFDPAAGQVVCFFNQVKQYDATPGLDEFNIYRVTWTQTGGWSPLDTFYDSYISQNSKVLNVIFDLNGNACLSVKLDVNVYRIFVSMYDAISNTWSDLSVIDSLSGGGIGNLRLEYDPAGNIVAVFTQKEDDVYSPYRVYFRRFW